MLKFTKSLLFVLLFQITVTYVSSTDTGLVKESHVLLEDSKTDKDSLAQNVPLYQNVKPHDEEQQENGLSTKKLNLLPKKTATTVPAIHPIHSATDATGSEPKKDPLMKSGRRCQGFFDMNPSLVSSSALEASHSSHQHESKSSSFSSMASGVVESGTGNLIINPPIAGNMGAMVTGGESSVAHSSSSHSHSHHLVSSSNSGASMTQGGFNLPGAVLQPGLVIPGPSQGFIQGSSAGESSLIMGSQSGAHQAINMPSTVVQPSLIVPGSSQGILEGTTSKSSSFSSMASGAVESGTGNLIINPPIAGNMGAMVTGGQSSVAHSSSSHSHGHHLVSSSNSGASMTQGGFNLPGVVVQPGLVIPGPSQGFIQGSSAGESSLIMGSQSGAHQAINMPSTVVQPSLIVPGSSQGILEGTTSKSSSFSSMASGAVESGTGNLIINPPIAGNMGAMVTGGQSSVAHSSSSHSHSHHLVSSSNSGASMTQGGFNLPGAVVQPGLVIPGPSQGFIQGSSAGESSLMMGSSMQGGSNMDGIIYQTPTQYAPSFVGRGQSGQYLGQSGQYVGQSGYDFGLYSPNLNVLQPGVLNNYGYGEQAAAVALSMLEDGLYADELARLQQGHNMMVPAQPNAFIAVPVFRPDAGNVMLGYRPNIRYYIDQIGLSNFLKRFMTVHEVPSFFSNFRAGQYIHLTQAQLQIYKKYLIKTGLIHLKPFQLIFSDNYWMKLPSVQWMVVDLGSWKQGSQTLFGSLNMNSRKLLVPILKLRNGFRRSMSGARTIASGVKEISEGVLRAAKDIPSHAAKLFKLKEDKKSN